MQMEQEIVTISLFLVFQACFVLPVYFDKIILLVDYCFWSFILNNSFKITASL